MESEVLEVIPETGLVQTEKQAPIELANIVKQSGLHKANVYALTFAPAMITVNDLSAKLDALNREAPTVTDAKIARECRLALVKNRTAIAKTKYELKSGLMAESNLIQALHNVIVSKSTMVESDFEAIEKHAEKQEANRKAELKAQREVLLSEYVSDVSIYPLGEISEQAFSDLLTGQRMAYEARIAAEKKAEEERVAKETSERVGRERFNAIAPLLQFAPAGTSPETLSALNDESFNQFTLELKDAKNAHDKEQERIRLENERLKKEAEEIKKEREAAEAEARRIASEAQAKLDAERKESERLAAELKSKHDAETKAMKEKEEAQQAELSKGDKERFDDLLKELDGLKAKYQFKSKKYQALQSAVNDLITKTILYAENKKAA